MNPCVMLLRGINVGGRHSLPMAELRAILADCGATAIQTYIQSGNVVFTLPVGKRTGLGVRVREAIGQAKDFSPEILVMGAERYRGHLATNPWADEDLDPRLVHVFFLDDPGCKISRTEWQARCAPTEEAVSFPGAVFLKAPDGIARSRFPAALDRLAPCAVTARNWRTATKILDLLEAY